MDKQAYHYNKKKIAGTKAGTFLYYYPCEKSIANTKLGNKYYVAVEVTEQEWETLVELDRLEYNNEHAYNRHKAHSLKPAENEECLPTRQQEELLTPSFAATSIEKIDLQTILSTLPVKERKVYQLCVAQGLTQKEAAQKLGVTQGYVSRSLQKAQAAIEEYSFGLDNDPDEVVWKYWQIFMKTFTMPNYLDVELEFVIRGLVSDLLVFLHWFYSVGEFCRFVMKYYLFRNESMQHDVDNYCSKVSSKEKAHFMECYGGQPLAVQAVFVRLLKEANRRRKSGLYDSDKLFVSFYDSCEKVAKSVGMPTEDYLRQRFAPFFTNWRNERTLGFCKFHSNKK